MYFKYLFMVIFQASWIQVIIQRDALVGYMSVLIGDDKTSLFRSEFKTAELH